MDLKTLKSMTLDDLLNMDFTKLNEKEALYVERRLNKTANQRIKRLKQSKKLSKSGLSASEKRGLKNYQIPKSRVKTTKGGRTVKINVRNKLIKSANKARNVLTKKTSLGREIDAKEERYRKVINKTLGAEVKLDSRRLKRVGRLMAKAKEIYDMGSANKKFSGSPKILEFIVNLVKSRKYIKNDEAEQAIMTAITEGYETAQKLLKDMLEEDNKGVEIGDDTDLLR